MEISLEKKNKKNSFSKKNIIKNNLEIINYISTIINKYDFILVSVISPLLKTRKIAKKSSKKIIMKLMLDAQ